MSEANGGRLQERVQQCFAAYRAGDRHRLAALLAPEFTFSSPYDMRLIRLQYLERCWPDSERAEARQVEKIVENGDEALVQYTCELNTGECFRGFGRFVFKGDKVKAIEVFVGGAPAGFSDRETNFHDDVVARGMVFTKALVSTASVRS
jgi:hypothetical protein